MKQLGFYVLAFAFLIAGTWFYSDSGKTTPAESVSEASNTVLLGQTEAASIVLSSTFARQLSSFGFEFGDFSAEPVFLGLVAGDTKRVELLRDGENFATAYELPLPPDITYAELLSQIQNKLGETKLQNAVFGPDSFYFLRGGFATNIIPLERSALAFRFDPANFEEIRRLISALIIFSPSSSY